MQTLLRLFGKDMRLSYKEIRLFGKDMRLFRKEMRLLGKEMRLFGKDIGRLFFPQYCTVCGRRLLTGENTLCTACMVRLPLARIDCVTDNAMVRRVWGEHSRIVRGTALFRYNPGSAYSRLLFDFKYHNHPQTAVEMGRVMARDLMRQGFFEGIDLIVPVPLSKERKRRRGYNQSERLAHGVSLETGIPVDEQAITRIRNNPSQTNFSATERFENVADLFSVERPELLTGRHLLLLDDVFTTGSTLRSLAETISVAADVKISIAALAIAESGMRYNLPTYRRD